MSPARLQGTRPNPPSRDCTAAHRRRSCRPGHGLLTSLLGLLALVCTGCQGLPAPTTTPATLRIAGATSMAPTLREVADAYQMIHPNVRVEVLGNGSLAGMRELQAGAVDIAAISWKADDEEHPQGFEALPFARDAVAVIVHPGNRVAGFTLAQARSLFRGEIQDWAMLGGPSLEPSIISREDGSGTRQAFESTVMGGQRVTFNALVMPNTWAVVDHVSRHPEAVGYVSMSALTDTVRAVPIEGMLPVGARVRDGAYHLVHYLYLLTAERPSPEVSRFLDFVRSAEGQAIIERRHVSLH